MLTIGAWLRYVRRRSGARYLPVVVLFALGLMAKQMIVTLPCVLLLLDYWPLGRFARKPGEGGGSPAVFLRLVVEKLPLFALSIASCVQSLMARTPEPGGMIAGTHTSWLRTGNALVSYLVYTGQMFYPVKLAVFYPFPAAVPAWQAAGALAAMAGVSVAAFVWRRKQPAFLAGWFWYAGMMAPVAGFIRLGKEAHADRYTYLPQIGLYIAVTWLAAGACARLKHRHVALGGAAAAVVCALMIAAFHQTFYWRDSTTLWNHTLECTHDNFIALNHLGAALAEQGVTQEAIPLYREALRITPAYPDALYNLGSALLVQGQTEEAIAQFRETLRIDPAYADAHNNLGVALAGQGKTEEAIAEFHEALRYNPGNAAARGNLDSLLLQQGRH
jgi:tetratricopeptide (TPR) repeat protein